MFTKTFYVRWADLDSNGHMKNTAYLDVCVDARMMFFAENGFSMRDFEEIRIGPVVMRDEVEYFREMRLLDEYTIDLALAAMSEDASRFRLRNRFFRQDGRMAAAVHSTGGWLDLQERRLIRPPERLRSVLAQLQRTEDFEELPSSIRAGLTSS
ncbi:MAG TPA: thioesterase family protein [Thermoanaerobaculia bacterium]|nr:thioesterase family protein [Thermoanaerobaculia bacterium]